MTSLFPSPKYLSSYCKLSLLDQNHYNLVTVNCLYLTLRISSYAKMGTICHRRICLVPRAHYCAQPMLFRSSGLSKFFIVLVIRLGYITEMHWSRRCEKMLYRDEGRGICPLPHMSITQNVSWDHIMFYWNIALFNKFTFQPLVTAWVEPLYL